VSKAYLKGTVKKVFDLQSGQGKKGPWTRQDMVVTKEDGNEQILKVWDGDQIQVYEGATIEAHGKLDEYKGEVRVTANANDVTVNGTAPATPEVARTVLSGGPSAGNGQATIPFTRLQEINAEWYPKLLEMTGDPVAAATLLNTDKIALTKHAKVVDDDGEEVVPF
jgi:hypothetical protein